MALADESPCVLDGGTGVITGDHPEPSAPLALPLLDTIVDVHVTHPGGFQCSYQVTIRRGDDKIFQYAYGKASNTGTGDRFGINGNQADDTAVDSGAVYIFH